VIGRKPLAKKGPHGLKADNAKRCAESIMDGQTRERYTV
jgi:hypothetical protein